MFIKSTTMKIRRLLFNLIKISFLSKSTFLSFVSFLLCLCNVFFVKATVFCSKKHDFYLSQLHSLHNLAQFFIFQFLIEVKNVCDAYTDFTKELPFKSWRSVAIKKNICVLATEFIIMILISPLHFVFH